MKIRMFQVDAFSENLFGGNPAAVCILNKWLDESFMQKIAEENNLSETAFVIKKDQNYEIRWFTPEVEVDLCGHATLASAHILFEFYIPKQNEITFVSRYSGILKVKKEEDHLILDFPVGEFNKATIPPELIKGLGKKPIETYKGKTDYMFVYSKQEDIENLNPDFQLLAKSDARGIIVSAHTILTPFWSNRLKKQQLEALQLSKRKGLLKCKLENNRVKIAGKAKTYFEGEILLPD